MNQFFIYNVVVVMYLINYERILVFFISDKRLETHIINIELLLSR